MKNQIEIEFHEAMLDIYRKAQREEGYTASRFLQMVVEHGGLEAANILINADNVSEGYAALWERGRLELTVEAVILDNEKFHSLFTGTQLIICETRLQQYGYNKMSK